MAENVAPPRGRRSPTHNKKFAAGFADNTNLRAQASLPAHAPQLVDFHNAGSTHENAVYTNEQGVTCTEPVAPGQTLPVEVPVATLKTSGTNVSATCYWFHGNSIPFNAA